MNELEIMNIKGIECYEKDGVAYLNLETCARGLGFTETAASGNECVRWRTVRKYLSDFGIATSCDGDKLPDYISENIFYRLAMKAKNAVAEAFQAKIADEVIPSIRRHGAYMTPDTLDRMITSPEFGIKLLTALKDEQEKRKALEVQAEADRPKVLFADSVTASKSSILVGEMAKLLKQNGIETGQNRLFETLREKGFLIRRKGNDYNMPTQKAMEMGLFEIKETVINHADGHTSVNKTPKVTGKGQQYFVNMFLGDDA
ncbi:phage antirepressor KilAC domain-containing protein [uncultured Oscillibacter sp.]|uniref:phage antirepressor KilAC domain-containing protein n=1 Tax=uncultured Oscillibacter sp. TaxID=876091 RepID=UPI0025D2F026|nr:phage antirepressor KilAC domain-containing protein [uncultured Oscillibacter sp.]